MAAAVVIIVGCKEVKKEEQETVGKDSTSVSVHKITNEAVSSSATAKIDADVALKFVNGYVAEQVNFKDLDDTASWIEGNPYATEKYKEAVHQDIDDINNDPETILDSDIILGAQDYDDSYVVAGIDESKGYVHLEGAKHKEFRVTVKLVQQNGKWLVDDCGH